MNYQIECRRQNTKGRWLGLGNYKCPIYVAKSIAQDLAIELERGVRLVSYGKVFQIHAEFDKQGQPPYRS
jgi:hypothetical protein